MAQILPFPKPEADPHERTIRAACAPEAADARCTAEAARAWDTGITLGLVLGFLLAVWFLGAP